MYKLFFIAGFYLPTICVAQNAHTLQLGMRRAFADPLAASRMYSLALDSMQAMGSDTLLFNFFALNDSVSQYPGCGYLGGPDCNEATTPTWVGRYIKLVPNGLQLCTVLGDTLNLLFPTVEGDTIWFHSDAVQRFGLTYLGTDTATVLTVQDLIRSYRIVHMDISGNVIASVLNEAPVTVGSSLGLIEFFQVDSFPSVHRRLRMIGDAQWQIGLHCITEASIHDHQIGDVVQYRHSSFSVFPTTISGSYLKMTVLSRTESDTTVNYIVQEELFQDDGTVTNSSIMTRTYSKLDTIASIPFESFNGMRRTMRQVDQCGMLLWVYEYDPDNLWWPCPWGPCWSPWVNGTGPNPESWYYHVLGLGSGHVFSQSFPAQPWGGLQYLSHQTSIPYFVKNGIPCGTEAVVGIDDLMIAEPGMQLAPNPAQARVQLLGIDDAVHAELYNASGRLVMDLALTNSNWLELGDLNSGLYLMRVTTRAGVAHAGRLLIER